jgi:hypothetical protein
MAALASLARFQADSVAKLGQLSQPLDLTAGVQYDYPSGFATKAYTVPTSNRFKAKAVAFSIRPDTLLPSVLNLANGQGGVAFISIGGTVVEERPFYGFPLLTYTGSDEQNYPYQIMNGLPTYGEGVTVNSGQEILIRCTPKQATLQVWRVTISGRRGTTTDIRTAVVQTYLTTANQTLLSYTPASDYTLLGIKIEAEQPGHVFGGLQFMVNGLKTFETGYFGYEGQVSNFMDNSAMASHAHGALVFPLWGMTFGEGDNLDFTTAAISDHGMHMTCSVFGIEEAIGGGVAGATSFAF